MCNNCNGMFILSLYLSKILCDLECLLTVDPEVVSNLLRMQAHLNPMTVAGEYPTILDSKFVVSTSVRFLDMLNTDLYVIFKIDDNSSILPVYFKDAVEYEHPVVLAGAIPVTANLLLLNGIYSAKYQYLGGYIILDSLIPLNPNIIL